MRLVFFTLVLFFAPAVSGQISASVSRYDFGDLYNGSQSYVDIVFTNNSDRTQYLLTIDKPGEVYYIFSGKKMLPDSSITIRFKVNDQLKGKFSYQADIYFSDSNDPMPVYLTGNIREITQNSLTDCPDFDSRPGNTVPEFTLIIKVIDSITREPIPDSKVYLVERGELVGQFSTNNKGIVHRNLPLGYYFITAEKKSYRSNFFEGYVNASRNYIEIELSKEDGVPTDPVVEVQEPEPVDSVVEPEMEIPVEVVVADTAEAEPEPVVIPPLADLPDTLLDPSWFKYNNITFILDASSSMNGHGKMDLLKLSMIELVKILRPEDNITVLKYAAEVDMVLNHTPGDRHEEIIQVIKGIRTSGSTAGGDAIKTAYRLNREKYIQGGNNLVIMITDGLFNKGAMDYEETIESNFVKYGTRFSVVGIKTTDYVTEHMQKVVQLGGGDFVRINSVEDAQTKLINEIRRTSYKGL